MKGIKVSFRDLTAVDPFQHRTENLLLSKGKTVILYTSCIKRLQLDRHTVKIFVLFHHIGDTADRGSPVLPEQLRLHLIPGGDLCHSPPDLISEIPDVDRNRKVLPAKLREYLIIHFRSVNYHAVAAILDLLSFSA